VRAAACLRASVAANIRRSWLEKRQMINSKRVTWYDRGRSPQYPSNADYPSGIDVDVSGGAAVTCTESLPHPAKRCGYYLVECVTCGLGVALTTAGRADDPRSVKMPCNLARLGH
jgi:hypothetical protein